MWKHKLKYKLTLILSVAVSMMIILQIVYYTMFYTITQEREANYASNSLSQVEENINVFSREIKDTAIGISYNSFIQKYLLTEDPIYRIYLYNIVQEILTGIHFSNRSIKAIILIDEMDRLIGPSEKKDYDLLAEFKKDYSYKDSSVKGSYFTKGFNVGESNEFFYAFVLPIFEDASASAGNDQSGTCIIFFRTDYLQNVVSAISPLTSLMILDQENRIVSDSQENKKGEVFEQSVLEQIKQSKGPTIDYNHIESLFQYKSVAEIDWSILSLMPVREVAKDLQIIRITGFILGGFMTIIIFIMGVAFIRDVTKPIGRMVSFMKDIGNNHAEAPKRIIVNQKDEVGFLAHNINKMLDKIDEVNRNYIHTETTLYQMELAKKQAELSALQSQIFPHFLFNTLECIRSIALANDIKEIEEITTAMAYIFRYSIKPNTEVMVAEEIECIRKYLKIMSIRFGARFTFEIDVEPAVYNSRIIKMLLQPIVENAVFHGLEQKHGPGSLLVKGEKMDEHTMRFIISDDGKGISEAEMIAIQLRLEEECWPEKPQTEGRLGVGIFNIHQRILMTYGPPYGFSIISGVHQGTMIEIKLPFLSTEVKA